MFLLTAGKVSSARLSSICCFSGGTPLAWALATTSAGIYRCNIQLLQRSDRCVFVNDSSLRSGIYETYKNLAGLRLQQGPCHCNGQLSLSDSLQQPGTCANRSLYNSPVHPSHCLVVPGRCPQPARSGLRFWLHPQPWLLWSHHVAEEGTCGSRQNESPL